MRNVYRKLCTVSTSIINKKSLFVILNKAFSISDHYFCIAGGFQGQPRLRNGKDMKRSHKINS